MAYKMNRLDPENYSEDILRVVEALRLPSGDDPMFQGSSALKVVYPSDYDLAQYVKVQRDMKRDFQAVVRKLMKLREAYIGDIKSGEIPELKVIPDNTNSRNYNGRRQGFLTKLKQLVDRKYITSKEYSDSVRLLQPDLTELDMFIIKHDIRFEVVRWTPKDILKGFVVYRKHKVDFNTYLFGNNITKIDIVAWVNGNRYSEITMNYKFVGQNGLVVNNKGTDVLNEILGEVPYLFYKGKYLKICKRMFSIETLIANTPQLNREPNKLTQRRLYKLFNGDLNLLNQITGDIGNLIYLVDNVEHIDKERFEYEVDQMKYRLGVITNLRYLKIEPVVAQMLEQLEGNVVSLRVLEKLESFIRGFIEGEVKKQMKKWKLLPIPRVYLPSDRIDLEGGGEDMLGEGMKGGALFPEIEIRDSKLPAELNGKIMGSLGDGEEVRLKKIKSSFPNDPYHYIDIFPIGKPDEELHLEITHKEKELHIKSINANKYKKLGITGLGTYLFEILFRYLKYRHMKYDTISLVFDPYEIDEETKKKIRSPAISMRAMKFYYRVFSQMADHYPMVIEQIRRPTEEDFQRIIDDYETGKENMIFRKSNVF